MDLPSLTTAMASITIARQAVSAALGVREFNAVAPALAGVNDQLLKAQDALFIYSARLADLQQKLSEREDELRELKRVKSERDQYALFEISEGTWVYRSKPSAQTVEGGSDATESIHYLCQTCFEKDSKSVLQREKAFGSVFAVCTLCNSKYDTGERYEQRYVF